MGTRLAHRLGIMGAVALVAAFLVVAPATPAGAIAQPTITVHVGEKVSNHYPALVGPNYQQGRRPASCAAASRKSCDTIAVVVDLPADKLAAGEYMLTFTTNWNVKATAKAPAVSNQPSDDQLNTFVYTDPPRDVDGTLTEEVSAFIAPPPQILTIFKPTTNRWLVTVENMYGVNDGYTFEVELADLGGGPGFDRSADEPVVDYSDDSAVAVTPSFTEEESSGPFHDVLAGGLSDAFSSSSLGGPRAITFDVLQYGGDADLDALSGIDDKANFSLGAARQIAAIRSGPPRPQSASGLELFLWFVLLPGLVAGGAVLVVIRRRRSLTI